MDEIFDQKKNPYCWKCETFFNHETEYTGYCSQTCFLNRHNIYKTGKCLGCGLKIMLHSYYSYCNIQCWEKFEKKINDYRDKMINK